MATNKTETHNGHKYSEGLNVSNDHCYYYSLSMGNIFYDLGSENESKSTGIREITLPVDDKNFKITVNGFIYRSNMIVLGKKYFYDNIDDMLYFLTNISKEILYKDFIADTIISNCKQEHFETLCEIFFGTTDNDDLIDYDIDSVICSAIRSEHIELLNFIKNKYPTRIKYGRPIYKTDTIPNYLSIALKYGKISSADWCKNTMKITINTIHEDDVIYIAYKSIINSLEWLKDNGYKFDWINHDPIEEAVKYCNINTLEWYLNSGLNMEFSKNELIAILKWNTANNSPKAISKVKKWFASHGCNLSHSDHVFKNNRIEKI